MTAKLPTEAELDAIKLDWLTPPERATLERLVALGREYYALRRKLREHSEHLRALGDAVRAYRPIDRSLLHAVADDAEALLGEDGA